ncbi:hypothetical protein GE09DRAFT_348885 [Coniochaeta sp. 2T2.1]|nr:hypothetical protein GE09DRAFT_348885 [Coniochaeta sp. 2T2.1]
MKASIARATLALGLCSQIKRCVADFTGVSFDRITEGDSLDLTWDSSGLERDSFPLVITVSLINQTDSGVYGVKTNLSTIVNTTSYVWQGLPYPAPFLPTAQYQVEIRSLLAGSSNGQSVVARSPFFAVRPALQTDAFPPADAGDEPAPDSPGHRGLSRNASIALGVVVGAFSLMGVGVVVWGFRRRQRRLREAKRRQKRLAFVIS